jgi:hypothetical protein
MKNAATAHYLPLSRNGDDSLWETANQALQTRQGWPATKALDTLLKNHTAHAVDCLPVVSWDETLAGAARAWNRACENRAARLGRACNLN